MDKGTWIAGLAVIGYIAFEVYGVHTQRHLMEPLYIYEQYIGANHAMMRCGTPTQEQAQQFSHNIEVMRRRAGGKLADAQPNLSEGDIKTTLDENRTARIASIDAVIDNEGCESGQIWTLMKTYEQRARLNLH